MKLPSSLITLATFATLTLAGHRLYGGDPEIFLTGIGSQGGGIAGAYTLTGWTLNPTLVSGLFDPVGLAVSGNDLFVLDNMAGVKPGTVGEYDATTGAPVNLALISGLPDPSGIAISGSMIFLTINNDSAGTAQVAEYTTGGVLVNAALITGLQVPATGIAVSGSDLYVVDHGSETVGKYTTSGGSINPALITLNAPGQIAVEGTNLFVISPEDETVYNYTTSGVFVNSWKVTNSYPIGLAVSGTDVFVTDLDNETVREYTTTGVLVNNALISGVSDLLGITISAVGAPTPTPTPTATPKPTPTPTPKPTPTPTPQVGLSPTTFTVDGSASPTTNVVDTVLRFAAVQTGTPAGLSVRVQTSLTPSVASSWTDLNNGSAGGMIYDISSKTFVSSSANYPLFNGLYFRAIASAHGYPDSISNSVGPFSLASSTPRLSPPEIAVTGGGPFADLYFRSYVATATSGVALRIQFTTTPSNEVSWVDLNDGQAGHMKQSNQPNRFYLMANKLPAVTGVYYRVVASLAGYVDGLSAPFGPLNLILETPPTVTITPPKALSGTGTTSSPNVYSYGSLQFVVKATPSSGRSVKIIGLLCDGEAVGLSFTSNLTATFTPQSIGDHLVEAVAVDDLGASARNGTAPLHIRTIPSTINSAEKEETATSGPGDTQAATVPGRVFTVAKSGGNWNDPTTWKDSNGNTGIPGEQDLAIVGSSSVKCPFDVVAGSVTLSGGQIIGPGTLDIYGVISISSGAFVNASLYIGTGGVCNLTNSVPIQMAANVVNFGTWNVHGGGGLLGLVTFDNAGTTNFQVPLTTPLLAGQDPTIDTRVLQANAVTNLGLVHAGLDSMLIGQDGSSIVNTNGSNIVSQGAGNIVSQGAGNIVSQGAGNIVSQGAGNIVSQGAGNGPSQEGNTNSTATPTPTPSGYMQSGGETDLDGLTITGPVTLNGGVLSGSGVIDGDLTNTGGFISPGHSPGVIGVTGSFTQSSGGTMVLEDGGITPDAFDQLEIAGTATLGGTLDLQLINGYSPGATETFSPLGYTTLSGQFASISSNATVTFTANGANAAVNPAVAGPTAAASRNISTRALVQTGDNVVIGGFIVTGPAGSTKKVIIRGIGPSLTAAGVSGALGDPYLQLFSGSALLASNDNWKENEAAVEASGVAPTNDLESAIVATLAPGSYTAVLSGTNGTTGVGLVEVYDLAPTSAALLANISTRCSVQEGDNVLIGGFILQGTEPSNVLIRAIGPSLTAAGVTGALQDPVLELHDANGAVIMNDDWINTQEAEITATGVPPSDPRESAILATLSPGAYTAIVTGKNGGTGVGLVEVYNIQ
ncbi:MAG: beta strand repeat-containing protein [Chthoniobacterales bacterium]